MLRRRFLVNEEVAPDFIITYYAPQHIPFAGGYTGILRGCESNTEYGNENNTVFKCVLDEWSDGVGQYGIKMLNDTHGLWYNQWSSRYSEFIFSDMNLGRLGIYMDIIDNYPKYQMLLSNTITDVILPNEIKHLRGPLVSELLDCFNDSVVNVTLPENLESLDNNVLFTLHSLKNITIPATVNYMGHSTLNIHCDKDLSNTLIPDNRSLEEIILKPYNPPQTDAYSLPIGSYDPDQFYINPNLKIRVYADCLDKYKNDSVWGQYSNLYDTINNTIVYYDMDGRQLFEQLNDFTNVSRNSKLKRAISIYFPDSVTSIGAEAFLGYSSLTSIVIGNGVTNIEGHAFRGCSSLKSITIPNRVISIGDYAFYRCSSLTSATIGNNVTSIGQQAFSGCSSLTSVTISNSLASIEDETFRDCSSLTAIVIPDSVTSIGDNTFSGCTKLASIVIGNGVKSIGNYAFYGRKPLTSIVIPDSVENIGKYAFTYCSSLTDVTIGNSVISIGERAFSECSSLTSVIIPNSVTNISYGTFKNCSSLTSITIPSSLISIEDEAFFGCSSLTEIVIPSSVTSIGKWAFYYCESLSSIVIPDGVTSIGEWTLSYSGLTSITLPNSITSIGEHALAVCTSLTSITFQGTILQWNSIVLGSNWKSGVPATVVHCTDGDIEL